MSIRIRTEQVGLEESVNDVINRINRRGVNVKIRASDFTQPLGRITQKADEFSKSLEASNARVIAFGASAAIIGGVTTAFRELVVQSIAVERILTDINVVLGTSTKNLEKFGRDLFDVARNTSQALDVAAEAALEFSRQGLSMEETLRRTNDALILTRLTGIDAAAAVSGLTAAVNGFADAGLTTTSIINKLAAVDVKFAVSADDLIDALARAGAVAQDAGVNFDQLVGAVTAAQQITARGGAVIGNSFKTIFTRIQRSSTLNNLEKLNVAVRDIEGNTLPAITVLSNLAEAYKDMGDATSAAIAEQVGGVFQINVLKAALKDLSKENSLYAQATKISNSATDQAQQKNAMLQKTISSLAKQTSLTIQELSANIGELALSPGIAKLLEAINSFGEGLNNLLGDGEESGSSFARGVVKGFGSVLTGPGVVLAFGVFAKLFSNALSFAKSSLKDVLGIVTAKDKERNIQEAIVMAMSENRQLALELNKYSADKTKSEEIILGVIQKQTEFLAKQEGIAARLAPKLASMGVKSDLTLPRGSGSGSGGGGGRAQGFVPNYSAAEPTPIEAQKEKSQAMKAGYTPGRVSKMNIKGLGDVVYNDAETVASFDGMSQPAIMPPEKSKAGGNYMREFKSKHGFDPYEQYKKKSFSEGLVPDKKSTLKKKQRQQHKDRDGGSQNNESYFDGLIPNFADAHRMGNVLQLPKARMLVQTSATGDYKGNLVRGWKTLTADVNNIAGKGAARLSPVLDQLKAIGINQIQRSFYFTDQDPRGRSSAARAVNDIVMPKGKSSSYNDLIGNVYEQNLDKKLKGKNFIRTHTGTVKYGGKGRGKKDATKYKQDKKGKGDVSANVDFVREGRVPLEAKANSFSDANLIAKSIYLYSDKSLNKFLENNNLSDVSEQYSEIRLSRQKDTLSKMGIDPTEENVSRYGLAEGLIPNFIDPRTRAQKIRDVLRDPANKNIKFSMPKPKHFKAKSMWDQDMLREFASNPKQKYLGGTLKDYLIKKGYSEKELTSLAKNPSSYNIYSGGFVPNFSYRQSRRNPVYAKRDFIYRPEGGKDWYTKLAGKSKDMEKFLKWVRSKNKLPAKQLDKLEKDFLGKQQSYKQSYWDDYEKVKGGNASRHTKMNMYGTSATSARSLPGEELSSLNITNTENKLFIKKDKMDNLIQEWMDTMPMFASGYIPSFNKEEMEGMLGDKMDQDGKSKYASKGSKNHKNYFGGYIPSFNKEEMESMLGDKMDQDGKSKYASKGSKNHKNYFGGYIPNFATLKSRVESIAEVKDGDSIVGMVQSQAAQPIDHRLQGVDAVEKDDTPFGPQATKLAQSFYPKNKVGATNLQNNRVESGKASYSRGLLKDENLARALLMKGLGIPDLRYGGMQSYGGYMESARKKKIGIWQDGLEGHPKRRAIESQLNKLDPANLTSRKGTDNKTTHEEFKEKKYNIGGYYYTKEQLAQIKAKGADAVDDMKFVRGFTDRAARKRAIKSHLYTGGSGRQKGIQARGLIPNFAKDKNSEQSVAESLQKETSEVLNTDTKQSNLELKGKFSKIESKNQNYYNGFMPNFKFANALENYKKKKQTKGESMGKDDFSSTSTAIAGFNTTNALFAKTALSGAKGIKLTARNFDKIRQFLNSKEFRRLSAAVQNKVKKSLQKQSQSLSLPDVTRPWLQHGDPSYQGAIAASLGIIPNFKERKELLEDKMKADELGSQNSNDYSRGLIPNFSKDALQNAIQRESDAGIPKSLIKVERSPELQNPLNPLGLAVTNKIDEPGGVKEGINRAKEQGIDPRTHGSSAGLIPNFVAGAGIQKNYSKQLESSSQEAGKYLSQVAGQAQKASEELSSQASASSDLTGRYFMLTSVAYGLQGAFSEVEGQAGTAVRGLTTLAEAGTQAMLFKEGLGEVGKGISEKLAGKSGIAGMAGKAAGMLGPLGMVVGAAIPIFQYLNAETDLFKDSIDKLNDRIAETDKAIEGFSGALESTNNLQRTNERLKELEASNLKGTFKGRMEELNLLRQKASAESQLASTMSELGKETKLTAAEMKLMASGTAEGLMALQEKLLQLENVKLGQQQAKDIATSADKVGFFGGRTKDDDTNDASQQQAIVSMVSSFMSNLDSKKGEDPAAIKESLLNRLGSAKSTLEGGGRVKQRNSKLKVRQNVADDFSDPAFGAIGETLKAMASKNIAYDEMSETIDRIIEALKLVETSAKDGSDAMEGDTQLINQIREKRKQMFADLNKQAQMAQISMSLQSSAHDLAMTELGVRNQFLASLGTMTKAQQIRASAEEKITQNQLDYSSNVQSLNDEYLNKGRDFIKKSFEGGVIQEGVLSTKNEKGQNVDEASGRRVFDINKEKFAQTLGKKFQAEGKVDNSPGAKPTEEMGLLNEIKSSKSDTQILDHLETYANGLEDLNKVADFFRTLHELGLTQISFSNAELEALNDTLKQNVKAEKIGLDIKNKKVDVEAEAERISSGSLEYYKEVARKNQENAQYSAQVGAVLKDSIDTTIQKNANERQEIAAQMQWLANRNNLQAAGEEEYSNRLLAVDQNRKQLATESALVNDTQKLAEVIAAEVKSQLTGSKDKAKKRSKEAQLANSYLNTSEGLLLAQETEYETRMSAIGEARKQLSIENAITKDKAKLAAVVREEIKLSLAETATKNQKLIEESDLRTEYLSSVEGQSEAAKTQLSIEQLIISQQAESLAMETALVQDKAKLRGLIADQIDQEEQRAQNARTKESETHKQKMEGGFYGRRAVDDIQSKREGMERGLQQTMTERNFYEASGNKSRSAEVNVDVQRKQLEYNKEMGQGSLLLDTWRVKLAEANERLVNFSADLGETSFDAVKDGFKGLLQDISDGTKSTGEMMMGFIGGIAKKMQDKMFDRMADQMTSGLFQVMGLNQYHTGGIVQRYARGGSTAEVPAMLTSGEYVVRKKVVDKLGLKTMDKLNDEGSLEDLYDQPNEDQFSLFNEGGIAAPPIVKFQDGGSIGKLLMSKAQDQGDTSSQNDRSSVFSDQMSEFTNVLNRFTGGLAELERGNTSSKNDRSSIFSGREDKADSSSRGDTSSKNDRSSIFSEGMNSLNYLAKGGQPYLNKEDERKSSSFNSYSKDSFSPIEATIENYGSLGNRWYLSNKNRRENTVQDELMDSFQNRKKPKLGSNFTTNNRMKSMMASAGLPMFEDGGKVDGFFVKTKLTQDQYGTLGNRWYLENQNAREKIIQKTSEREREREKLVGFKNGGLVYMNNGGLTKKQADRRQGYTNMASGLGGMVGTWLGSSKKDKEYNGPTAPKKHGPLNTSSRLNIDPTGRQMSARFRKNDSYSQEYGKYLLDKYEYDVQERNQKMLERQSNWQAVANVVGMAAGTAIGNYVSDKITAPKMPSEQQMLVEAELDAQMMDGMQPAGGNAGGKQKFGGGSLLEMQAARMQNAGVSINKSYNYNTGVAGGTTMSFGSADSAPSIPGLKSGPTTHELNQNAQSDAIMALERLKYTVDLDKKNKGGLIQHFNRGGSVHNFTKIGNNVTKMKDGGLTRNGKVTGPGGIDQVGPVMLDRGEYVIKASSVSNVEKQYPGFFDKLNTMKMNQGGPVDVAGGASSTDNSSTTNNNQKSSSNVTVNINVSGSGKTESEGGDGEQQAFASRIKDAVVGIIAQEKRVGGMLSG